MCVLGEKNVLVIENDFVAAIWGFMIKGTRVYA